MRKNRFLAWLLIITVIATCVGCNKKEETPENNIQSVPEETVSTESIQQEQVEVEAEIPIEENKPQTVEANTIAGIKEKYGTLGEIGLTPIYNVSDTEEFVFRFNSKVEPHKAVTVHTDKNCEDDSLVYQTNEVYNNGTGYDIAVTPGKPVLVDTEETGTWGRAPIYYMCLHYDLESAEVKQLTEPIIIPFTIYREISTPNIEAYVNNSGELEIAWEAVHGAVEYRLYKSETVDEKSPAKGYDRAVCGYVGDILENIDTTTDTKITIKNETTTDSKKYVITQNVNGIDNYYITAVDKDGNESNYSKVTNGSDYKSKLPVELVSDNLENLPNTVLVKMLDNSEQYLPVRYHKIDEATSGFGTYEYNVIGSKLSGVVKYVREDKIYPVDIEPSSYFNNDFDLDYTMNIDAIPDNSSKYVPEVEYIKIESNQLTYSDEALAEREKIEQQRFENEGMYMDGKDPDYAFAEEILSESGSNEVTNSAETDIMTLYTGINSIIEGADEAKVEKADYVTIFAETAEEEYLVIMMTNGVSEIDLTAFPKLYHTETLIDTVTKVCINNPYILDVTNINLSSDRLTLVVDYGLDSDSMVAQQKAIKAEIKNMLDKILASNIEDDAKINTIWNHLYDEIDYDTKGYEKLVESGFTSKEKVIDSLNSYGVICKKYGLSKGFIDAFKLLLTEAGIECITVEYIVNANQYRRANLVKINDEWRLYDIALSKIVGTNYILTKANRDLVDSLGIKLLDVTEFDKTGNVSDYYIENSLFATNMDELKETNTYRIDKNVAKELILNDRELVLGVLIK